MIKKLLFIATILFSVVASAQETTSSPYSFYGVGLLRFNGTVENQSMGGLSIYSDSIHLNLRNPSAYGGLSLTTYSLGASHRQNNMESNEGSDRTSATSIDYLAIGIPAGKLGFGVGLIPYSSVGYRLEEFTETYANQFSGRGGLNRVYLSAGYQLNDNWKLGVEADYNFGNIQNKSIFVENGVQYGTREIDRSDINGFSFNFGLNYRRMLTESLEMQASAQYSPAASLNTEHVREISTITFNNAGQEVPIQSRDVEVENSGMRLPSEYRLGAGIGRPKSWFVGLEYGMVEASNFTNRSFNVEDAEFVDASNFRVGGFWVPKYNSLTNYFNRITYRAGFRYEETGLVKAGEAINEFGMSFGVGLPVGQWFSNANIGFEYGQRGTTAAGLVKENFMNISISLSLNDRWFVKNRFD